MSFKVGDRVKATGIVGSKNVKGAVGTIKYIDNPWSMLVEFDNDIGGHSGNSDRAKCKEKHGWWCGEDALELITESEQPSEPSEPSKPTNTLRVKCVGYKRKEKYFTLNSFYEFVDGKVTNDNGHTYKSINNEELLDFLRKYYDFEIVSGDESGADTDAEHENEAAPNDTKVDNYEKACWYCRKGGLVDLYLNGRLGICPSCGRVCNDNNKHRKYPSQAAKPVKKSNEPLTTEELEALPEGSRVFIVWLEEGKAKFDDEWTRWRVKQKDRLKWESSDNFVWLRNNGKSFTAYLEKPERPNSDKQPWKRLTIEDLKQMDGQKVWCSDLWGYVDEDRTELREKFKNSDCGWYVVNVKDEELVGDNNDFDFSDVFESTGDQYGCRVYSCEPTDLIEKAKG